MLVNLYKGDKVDNNVDYVDALPTNMYTIERAILDSDHYMTNFYGLTSFSTGEGLGRGGLWVSALDFEGHYRVSGESLISIDADGVTTVIGEITGSGKVSMAYSFNNLAIVADKKLYYYNVSDGLRQITDPDIGDPIDVVWVDGYFFLTDGIDIFHSDITDEESFLPLDFGNAQFTPDASEGLGVNEDNEVIVYGAFTTEYFVNVGTENFAFQRIEQKAQKIGVLGVHCKIEMNGKWYILGRRKESAPSCHVVSLGTEQDISSRAVDQILATYNPDDLSTSTIDAMIIDNTKFIIYHLPNHTLMFNMTIAEVKGTSNAWTILKSDVIADTKFRAMNPVLDPRNSKWIVDDNQDSTIGYLDKSTCVQYGNIVEWLLYSPFLNLETMSIDMLEIQTIPGVAPDENATVAISITKNGRTYSNEFWALYGDNYDYSNRFYLRNIGYIRHWIGFKFRGASTARMSFAAFNIEAS